MRLLVGPGSQVLLYVLAWSRSLPNVDVVVKVRRLLAAQLKLNQPQLAPRDLDLAMQRVRIVVNAQQVKTGVRVRVCACVCVCVCVRAAWVCVASESNKPCLQP